MAELPLPWMFVVVAAAIALAAFGLGQVVRGAGMILILGATTAWVVVAQRLWRKKAGG